MPGQGLVGLIVPEKARDRDEQLATQRLELRPVLLKQREVGVQRQNLPNGHAPLDPAVDRPRLIVVEIDAAEMPQQIDDAHHRLLRRIGRRRPLGLVLVWHRQ